MKIVLLLIALAALAASFSTTKPRHTRSLEERAVAWRMSAFAWIVGLLFIVALVFLPNKHRVLMLAPMVMAAVGIGKVWRQTRLRARKQAEVDFERMKRVN